jgi:hypothetical protein
MADCDRRVDAGGRIAPALPIMQKQSWGPPRSHAQGESWRFAPAWITGPGPGSATATFTFRFATFRRSAALPAKLVGRRAH